MVLSEKTLYSLGRRCVYIFKRRKAKKEIPVYSSPVGAGGRVYVTGREGTTVILERGPEFKVLSTNQLEDGFDASPAVVDKEIYLRGRRYLYRISEN